MSHKTAQNLFSKDRQLPECTFLFLKIPRHLNSHWMTEMANKVVTTINTKLYASYLLSNGKVSYRE